MSEISYVASMDRKFGGLETYYVGTDFDKANQIFESFTLNYDEDCYVLEVWSGDLKLMVYTSDANHVWRIDSDGRDDARYVIIRAEEEIEKLRNSLEYWEDELKENNEKCVRLDELIKRIPITEAEEV